MKKIFLFSMMYLMAFSINAQATSDNDDYIDLGLPSGTLWKTKNEKSGFKTYKEVIAQYGDKLPTKELFEELMSKCKWLWTGSGYKVTGPNGNSIFLPSEGYRDFEGNVDQVATIGSYWSSTPYDSWNAWSIYFREYGVSMMDNGISYGFSVRLVLEALPMDTLSSQNHKDTFHAKYVDLGLPSGALWKDNNEEGGLYTYEQALDRFGDKLPTREQFSELIKKCQWTWIGNGYKVTGPNGNSIFLSAAGSRNCKGGLSCMGFEGDYWSSTPSPNYSGSALYLYFYSGDVSLFGTDRCNRQSVRLVQD